MSLSLREDGLSRRTRENDGQHREILEEPRPCLGGEFIPTARERLPYLIVFRRQEIGQVTTLQPLLPPRGLSLCRHLHLTADSPPPPSPAHLPLALLQQDGRR